MTPNPVSFARQCQAATETVRVLYRDAICRLVEELGPKAARFDEGEVEDRVLGRFDLDGPDAHVTASLVALVSPLAPRLECTAADLVSLAVTAAAQDVIAEVRRRGGRS